MPTLLFLFLSGGQLFERRGGADGGLNMDLSLLVNRSMSCPPEIPSLLSGHDAYANA